MNKELIKTAFDIINIDELKKILLFEPQKDKKYSRENEITDLIALELGKLNKQSTYEVRKIDSKKYPDLKEVKNEKTLSVLEAKHYSPAQDTKLINFMVTAAEGPILDAIKLRKIGYEEFYILQYTTELTGFSGDIDVLRENIKINKFGFLKYYEKITLKRLDVVKKEAWTKKLEFYFTRFIDSETTHTIKGLEIDIEGKNTLSVNLHCYIMKISKNSKTPISKILESVS